MEDWTQIEVFTYTSDAYTAKSYLESEGIDVFLKDEVTTQVFNIVGGVKLMVPTEQADKAIELLDKGGFLKNK